MIQLETDRPVFSNAIGDRLRKRLTPEQKEARKRRLGEKARNLYTKAKDSGILSGLENLAIGNTQTGNTSNDTTIPNPETKTSWWGSKSKTTKTLIITTSILAISFSVYYFGFRKKSVKLK